MKIILKEDVQNLGHRDDVVEVKNGYALNYLIPQGFAIMATPSALKVHSENMKQRAHKEAKLRADAEALAAKLEGLQVTVATKVSSTGKVFGSVNNIQVAEALAAKGYEIYATEGTARFLNDNGVPAIAVHWPDEHTSAENNVLKMIAAHKFDLIVNIPKDHTRRELTNGYRIRRDAIDHNIPLMTNARLAKAFIEAFCQLDWHDIQIKSWQEYK